jgi:hypothetical protein
MSSSPPSRSVSKPFAGLWLFGLASVLATLDFTACAGEIVAGVKDGRGAAVVDAVVYATPLSGNLPAKPQPAIIAHQDQQFVPFVTAVQTGALINLPNRDSVKHHAYSFSPAKKFELPLYAGTPEAPLRFDQPGIVTIGCNIHDWMTAYVCIVETPFFAITGGDGRAQLRGLPPGSYRVEVWQPRLKSQPTANAQQIAVGTGAAKVDFALDLKPNFRARRNPASGESAYR